MNYRLLEFTKFTGQDSTSTIEHVCRYLTQLGEASVAPDFKNKNRYTLYVSPGSKISHIAINKGNIKRQCLLHSVLV